MRTQYPSWSFLFGRKLESMENNKKRWLHPSFHSWLLLSLTDTTDFVPDSHMLSWETSCSHGTGTHSCSSGFSTTNQLSSFHSALNAFDFEGVEHIEILGNAPAASRILCCGCSVSTTTEYSQRWGKLAAAVKQKPNSCRYLPLPLLLSRWRNVGGDEHYVLLASLLACDMKVDVKESVRVFMNYWEETSVLSLLQRYKRCTVPTASARLIWS